MVDKNDMLYIMGRIHSFLEVARVDEMLTNEEYSNLKRVIDAVVYGCVELYE